MSLAERIALAVAAGMERRAQEADARVERMLAREQADIRAAIETKSSVDGKASQPRLREQERHRAFERAARATAEVAREIAAEEAKGRRS